MKKYILHILIGLSVLGTVSAFDTADFLTPSVKEIPIQTKVYRTTATTTETGPAFFTHVFDTPLTPQGACLKIKDSDGSGYTYLTTLNGVGTFSKNSCE